MPHIKRHNHTVTRWNLARFADANQMLTRVELPGNRKIQIKSTKATVINDFYLFKRADGKKSDRAEELFGRIETPAATDVRRLLDHGVWPIPGDVKQSIAAWAALQYLRSPSIRQFGREIADEFRTKGLRVVDEVGQNVTVSMDDKGYDYVTGANLHLQFISQHLRHVSEDFVNRTWILVRFQRKALVTSDTPVVLIGRPGYPTNLRVRIDNAAEVYIPLDRRAALLLAPVGNRDRWQAGTAKNARYLNSLTIGHARRYLFHHPQDDPLSGHDLPRPRERELSDPLDLTVSLEELLDRYSA